MLIEYSEVYYFYTISFPSFFMFFSLSFFCTVSLYHTLLSLLLALKMNVYKLSKSKNAAVVCASRNFDLIKLIDRSVQIIIIFAEFLPTWPIDY